MRVLALLAYFPFFGWFFPMFLAPNDSFCQYHARQGFAAFLFFLLSFGVAWLVSHSIPSFLRYVEWALFVASGLFYLYMLVSGWSAVVRGIRKPLPVIGSKAEKLPV